MLARARSIRLTEPFKYSRQKLGWHTWASILDSDLGEGSMLLEIHIHLPTRRRKLHRVREQVPKHLL
jgi:hypothetical protein